MSDIGCFLFGKQQQQPQRKYGDKRPAHTINKYMWTSNVYCGVVSGNGTRVDDINMHMVFIALHRQWFILVRVTLLQREKERRERWRESHWEQCSSLVQCSRSVIIACCVAFYSSLGILFPPLFFFRQFNLILWHTSEWQHIWCFCRRHFVVCVYHYVDERRVIGTIKWMHEWERETEQHNKASDAFANQT